MFDRLFELHYVTCLRYARSKFKDLSAQDHEDIVQDVFEHVLSLDFEVGIGYLLVRVRWRGLNLIRDRRRAQVADLPSGAADLTDDVLTQVEIDRCLKTLSPRLLQVLLAFYFEGREVGDIADALGVHRNTVRNMRKDAEARVYRCIEEAR